MEILGVGRLKQIGRSYGYYEHVSGFGAISDLGDLDYHFNTSEEIVCDREL